MVSGISPPRQSRSQWALNHGTSHACTTLGLMPGEIKVWDWFVRAFHWSLVASFAVAYVTGDEESRLHVWSGYAILALLAARVVWGFIGTRHARFSDFVFPPRVIARYAMAMLTFRARRYLGHNPLGGAMVITLLVCLSLTGATGYLLLPADAPNANRSAATGIAPISTAHANGRENRKHDNDDGLLKELHEALAELSLILVFLHVAGVLASSLVHRENLVRAMITGRKRAGPD